MYECVSARERNRHRLLHHHVLPRQRRPDALVCVQPRGSRDRNDLRLALLQHFLVRRWMRDMPLRASLCRALRISVTHCRQLQAVDLVDGLEMVLADSSAPTERDTKCLLGAHLRKLSSIDRLPAETACRTPCTPRDSCLEAAHHTGTSIRPCGPGRQPSARKRQA